MRKFKHPTLNDIMKLMSSKLKAYAAFRCLKSNSIKTVKVYLNKREQELFMLVIDTFGESDSGIFLYLLKRYAEERGLIAEALHR